MEGVGRAMEGLLSPSRDWLEAEKGTGENVARLATFALGQFVVELSLSTGVGVEAILKTMSDRAGQVGHGLGEGNYRTSS